jgi:microcystin-dependent protein
MFTDESTQLTAFTESHYNLLSGATSNLQTQINNVSTKSTFINTPIIINNSSLDDTIAKYDQPDYLNLNYHNAITIQPISTDRTFFIGSLSDATDGAVAQFMIGANGGGAPDPNILMSLSRDAVYFFGVKQPLVPVGAIQIYAGSSAPEGYLLCQGQAISKSTYNLLWDLIGNTYLNDRAGGTPNFYLPDLRGVFIRGVGLSTAYSPNVTGGTLGEFQTHSVQDHYHKYSRSNDSITVGGSNSVSSNSVWDNSVATSTTQGGVYDESGDLLVAETRPANISMNYIIKF